MAELRKILPLCLLIIILNGVLMNIITDNLIILCIESFIVGWCSVPFSIYIINKLDGKS